MYYPSHIQLILLDGSLQLRRLIAVLEAHRPSKIILQRKNE